MKFPTIFTAQQIRILTELEERDRQERQARCTAPMRVRTVSRTVAQFLLTKILSTQSRTIVEFGTSAGYSTMHLATAARRTGGRVFSVDNVPEKTAWARQNLHATGLDDIVELSTADGVPCRARTSAHRLRPGRLRPSRLFSCPQYRKRKDGTRRPALRRRLGKPRTVGDRAGLAGF